MDRETENNSYAEFIQGRTKTRGMSKTILTYSESKTHVELQEMMITS